MSVAGGTPMFPGHPCICLPTLVTVVVRTSEHAWEHGIRTLHVFKALYFALAASECSCCGSLWGCGPRSAGWFCSAFSFPTYWQPMRIRFRPTNQSASR
eukprot:scaffold188183_cov51-Prasinocladus_malaysianus.AAC.1